MPTHTISTRALFDKEPYLKQFTTKVIAIGELGVALEDTLFYPTGGGQPGDQGYLVLPDNSVVEVMGTNRDTQNQSIIWHQLKDETTSIRIGMNLQGNIDWDRRYQHMRMHTCLHLLSSIIDAPITGCSIAIDKGRLDFDLQESTLDKANITYKLNELVNAGLEVTTHIYPASHYKNALDITRTKSAKPPLIQNTIRVVDISGLDIQPCGGTHVQNTNEIGKVVCEKIEKKSKHNRRVTLRFV